LKKDKKRGKIKYNTGGFYSGEINSGKILC